MSKIAFSVILILWGSVAISQSETTSQVDVEKNWKKSWENLDVDKLVAPTKSDPKFCKQYNGKFIAYYSRVYFVENCERRELSTRDIYEVSKNKAKIHNVEASVINKLVEGDKFQSRNVKVRDCKVFDNKYVTAFFTELYFVKNCKKSLFPDWETYRSHRQKRSTPPSEPLYEVSLNELNLIKTGESFPSILDEEAESLTSEEMDILPLDEACSGVNSKFVYYYSKVYFIDKCHKRLIDYQTYNDLVVTKGIKLIQLTSSQWMSIPDGEKYK